VIGFLSERPERSFGLLGYIHSNGLVSPHNRGDFYACRDAAGRLEGVALIGHHILFEARSEAAICLFAALAQRCSSAYMLLAVSEDARTFWRHYADGGAAARLMGRRTLFEQLWPVAVCKPVAGLRLATPADLDLIVPTHALLALADSGEDPLQKDAEGFRARCLHRIEQQKTWVWIEDDRLKFKVEVVTDSPEVIYLEGLWVDPQERRKGHGRACLLQLAREFLRRTQTICLLADSKQPGTHAFYRHAGYKRHGVYETIFLKPRI
jgi:GNAT superfamily N-acetyltransferase